MVSSPIAIPRDASGKVDVPMLLLNIGLFAGAVAGTVWLLRKTKIGRKAVGS